jgi:hypothetical protein
MSDEAKAEKGRFLKGRSLKGRFLKGRQGEAPLDEDADVEGHGALKGGALSGEPKLAQDEDADVEAHMGLKGRALREPKL